MAEGIRATGDSTVVAVVGLGYVGLPLVIEFGKRIRTIGFDIQADKVDKCRRGSDPSRELSASEMRLATHAEYTSDPAALRAADFNAIADLGVELCTGDALPRADAMVAAVAHREYREFGPEDICRKLVPGGCFVDVKSAYDASALEAAGVHVWRL